MDTANSDSLRLTPSNARTALLFAAMVVWFVLGLSRYTTTGGILPLALSIVGLAGAVVYGLMMMPGSSYLQANSRGITISTAFRRRSYSWSEIESFSVETIWSRKVVKYRVYGDATGAQEGEREIREETLPDTYGLPAGELADQLNSFRRRNRQ